MDQNCNASGKTITNLEVKKNATLANGVIDASLKNAGYLSNITITENGGITGGKVTGFTKNEGRMEDFEFVGASITGANDDGEIVGILAGKVTNNSEVGGSFEEIRLAPETLIIGGILKKQIIGDSEQPAILERLHIKANSFVSNVIIEKDVTYGENVTFANVEFRTEVVQEVTLQGNIKGTRFGDTYTKLEAVVIGPQSTISNLVVGNYVKFGEDIVLGENVSFSVHESYMVSHNIDVLPNLNGSAAIDNQGNDVSTWARLQGGARLGSDDSSPVERYQKKAIFKRNKPVDILGNVLTDVRHIGQKADILVVATYTPPTASSPSFYMLDNNGTSLPWDGTMSSLTPFQAKVSLTPVIPVSIWNNPLDIAGDLQVYFGYRLIENGSLVYSLEDVIEMTLTE